MRKIFAVELCGDERQGYGKTEAAIDHLSMQVLRPLPIPTSLLHHRHRLDPHPHPRPPLLILPTTPTRPTITSFSLALVESTEPRPSVGTVVERSHYADGESVPKMTIQTPANPTFCLHRHPPPLATLYPSSHHRHRPATPIPFPRTFSSPQGRRQQSLALHANNAGA
ncbi:hypothetical protein R3P38DRAFT_3200328 [Favolaschia claudopus]|uniref:Uncharacterized protein n=1 Tax=Favolaschia claudopus TaxID=2862362 RepID=A0AAW0AZR3_9AGAR